MQFNSWSYIIFYLFLMIPLYWLIPSKGRSAFITIASILFYSMWRWEFSLLMIGVALIDYYAALAMAASQTDRKRRFWLILSVTANIGLLVVFKYTYFLHDNFRFIAGIFGHQIPSLQEMGINIILPMGISFFTFQTLNYTIDIYRRTIEPTRNLVTYLAYVTFWPHLVAGPILRASEVLPQLSKNHAKTLTLPLITEGTHLILSGLFKKCVFADFIATRVDYAFMLDPHLLSALDVWVAAILFGFQIYFDFSGYSDIAIGTARLLGVHLPDNFNWPYSARVPREFWQKWHISLSNWIKDYLYVPLLRTRLHKDLALFLTWALMGLWHGASWNFVIWGVYHASLIFIFRVIPGLATVCERLPILGWGITFPLSMLGWIPFRAVDVSQTKIMFLKILQWNQYGLGQRMLQGYAYSLAGMLTLIFAGAYIVSNIQWRNVFNYEKTRYQIISALGRTAIVALAWFLVILYLRPVRQFIYFQF